MSRDGRLVKVLRASHGLKERSCTEGRNPCRARPDSSFSDTHLLILGSRLLTKELGSVSGNHMCLSRLALTTIEGLTREYLLTPEYLNWRQTPTKMTEKIRTVEADLNAKAQKRAYELAVSNLETKFKEELKTLQAAFDVEKGRLKFLQVNIDNCAGHTILEVDSVQISCHRIILADKSPVFRRMFASGLVDKTKGVIRVAETTHQVMQAVVTYCYTAEISFSSEIPPDEVLKVAHKYEIGHLKVLCDQELCKRIDMKNLPHMLKVSRQFEALELQQKSSKFFKENFDKVQEGVLRKY